MSDAIETILGHHFTRPELLREALTHRSALQGSGRARGSNERLEFVGDRVLGLLMAEWLAERFPREQEGDLGRRLAHLVSQPVLAAVAEQIGLGGVLSVAPGEARAGVKRRATVLADALEAALGRGLLRRRAGGCARRGAPGLGRRDACPGGAAQGRQDHAAGMGAEAYAGPAGVPGGGNAPARRTLPEFVVAVQVGGAQGTGTAGSKRIAEQTAAADLLRIMGRPMPGTMAVAPAAVEAIPAAGAEPTRTAS